MVPSHVPGFMSQAAAEGIAQASNGCAGHGCELSAAAGAEPRPTLSTASKKRDGRPQRALTKMLVTLAAIAAIAQTGYTSPVAAAGMPRPLKRNARTTFCLVLR